MDIATRKMNSKLGETVDAEEKLKEINEAMDSLRLSRERLRGERDQLERRVGKCREDLKDQNLKNIESKYKNLLIEKTTLNMAVQDLDQYYKALVSYIFSKAQMNRIGCCPCAISCDQDKTNK